MHDYRVQTAMIWRHKNWCMTPLTSWNFHESHWGCATKTLQTCHCCSQKVISLKKYSFILVLVKIYRKLSKNSFEVLATKKKPYLLIFVAMRSLKKLFRVCTSIVCLRHKIWIFYLLCKVINKRSVFRYCSYHIWLYYKS